MRQLTVGRGERGVLLFGVLDLVEAGGLAVRMEGALRSFRYLMACMTSSTPAVETSEMERLVAGTLGHELVGGLSMSGLLSAFVRFVWHNEWGGGLGSVVRNGEHVSVWKKKKRTSSREWKMPRDGTRCEVLVDAAAAKARGVSRMSTIAQSVSGACDFGVPLGARTDLRIHCERSSFEDGHQRIGIKMFGWKSGSCQRRGQTWRERVSTKSPREASQPTQDRESWALGLVTGLPATKTPANMENRHKAGKLAGTGPIHG